MPKFGVATNGCFLATAGGNATVNAAAARPTLAAAPIATDLLTPTGGVVPAFGADALGKKGAV